MSPYVRTVRTGSGATAVQIVWSKRQGRRQLAHVGSAHYDVGVAVLRQEADRRVHAGEDPLFLPTTAGTRGSFPVLSSRADRLLGALDAAWPALRFDRAVPDEVFRGSCWPAWWSRPASWTRSGSWRDWALTRRRLRGETASRLVCGQGLPGRLEAACAEHARVGGLRFCLYDVTTLWFETHQGDGLREPGFSKERRLEPQITVGLLTTGQGFPLKVAAFEGNKAETKTILPVLTQFRVANPFAQVTVVADAGMMSWDNLGQLEDERFTFVVGGRIPEEP